MDKLEYMKIKHAEIPTDVSNHYNLNTIVHSDGYVYINIQKGMPGLKQAGKIVHKQLKTHLSQCRYYPCPLTPTLWTHETQIITFALVVDNFGGQVYWP